MKNLRQSATMALEFFNWFVSDDHSINKPNYSANEIQQALKMALRYERFIELSQRDIDYIAQYKGCCAIAVTEAQLKLKNLNN